MSIAELIELREKAKTKSGLYEFGKYHQNFVYPKPEQDKIIEVIEYAIKLHNDLNKSI